MSSLHLPDVWGVKKEWNTQDEPLKKDSSLNVGDHVRIVDVLPYDSYSRLLQYIKGKTGIILSGDFRYGTHFSFRKNTLKDDDGRDTYTCVISLDTPFEVPTLQGRDAGVYHTCHFIDVVLEKVID